MNATREYWAGKHVVYRCYDARDELLYVGKSSNMPTRVDCHRTSTQWFGQVARFSLSVHRTHEDALAAERAAIRVESPRYNLRSAPGVPAGRLPASRTRQISEDGRVMFRAILKARRMTVRELAELCGGDRYRSAIGHIKSGRRVTCNEQLAERIQQVLLGDPEDDRIFLPIAPRLRSVS